MADDCVYVCTRVCGKARRTGGATSDWQRRGRWAVFRSTPGKVTLCVCLKFSAWQCGQRRWRLQGSRWKTHVGGQAVCRTRCFPLARTSRPHRAPEWPLGLSADPYVTCLALRLQLGWICTFQSDFEACVYIQKSCLDMPLLDIIVKNSLQKCNSPK